METIKLNPVYRVEALEEGGKHFYRVYLNSGDTLKLCSVTGILDLIGGSKTQALMGWAVKEALKFVGSELDKHKGQPIDEATIAEILKAGRKRPERIKDAAADLGTRVHALIDLWIAGKTLPELKEDEKIAFENFLNFVKERKLRFVSGDLAVASVKYGYGGRLDALALDEKDKLILFDWKTSNAIRDDYAKQVAGYDVALLETYGLKADKATVVRFDKVDPKVLDFRDVHLTQARKTWLSLVRFHKHYNRRTWKNGN